MDTRGYSVYSKAGKGYFNWVLLLSSLDQSVFSASHISEMSGVK